MATLKILKTPQFAGGVSAILDQARQTSQLFQRLRSDLGALEKVRKMVAFHRKHIDSIGAPIRRMKAQMERQLKPLRRFEAQMKRQVQQMQDGFVLIDKDNEWLLSVGWPPLQHASLDAARVLRRKCRGRSSKRCRRIVDDAIVAYYDRKRIQNEIQKEWTSRPLLEPRKEILKSAVKAHVRGEYALSVPTLLAQLEGILADYFGHRGRFSGRNYESCVRNLLTRDHVIKSAKLYERFFLEVVLANFEHGSRLPSDLSRHAILHGADIAYAKESTSLKAILLLDYVLRKLGMVSCKGSGVYHLAHCGHLRRNSRKRRMYQSEIEAEALGLKPCRTCVPSSAR